MSPSKLLAALLVIVGLSIVLFRQPSVVVSQSTPLESRVSALETRVSKLERVPTATPSPITSDTTGELTDSLGIPYEFVEIDSGLQVEGWEAYENQDGYWSIAGSVLNNHSTNRFSIVDFKIRFYKGQRTVQVEVRSVGGRWVDPGQTLPFEFSSSVGPNEFDRYTIELTAGDWRKAP